MSVVVFKKLSVQLHIYVGVVNIMFLKASRIPAKYNRHWLTIVLYDVRISSSRVNHKKSFNCTEQPVSY